MFTGLDHVAILVSNTEEALLVYRDQLGLPVLLSEVVNNGAVRLTHLDLGNTQLQLVEPLVESHPLFDQLRKNGAGLHHICFSVDDVEATIANSGPQRLEFAQSSPHQGTQGKKAAFLAKGATGGVQMEITGA